MLARDACNWSSSSDTFTWREGRREGEGWREGEGGREGGREGEGEGGTLKILAIVGRGEM